MVTRTFVTILASALIMIGVAAPAAAQNGYSFSDAARSATAYSRATVRPQMACRDLLGMTDPDMSIVSAEVFPGGDGVPEHCRVNGVLAPEIRFQVNLPAYWNRRFYMNGNGGFAGESPEAPNRAAPCGQAPGGLGSATRRSGDHLGRIVRNRIRHRDVGWRWVYHTGWKDTVGVERGEEVVHT